MKKPIFTISSLHARSCSLGAISVELAVVTVAMLLIVAGAIGFGRAYWYADALSKSTRDGARLLSTWPILLAAITDSGRIDAAKAGAVAARDLVISSANAANISPQLVTGNVKVECAYSGFTFVACDKATNPLNVRVRITGSNNTGGFSVNLSEWMPFVGGQAFGTVSLSPKTTMRYMN